MIQLKILSGQQAGTLAVARRFPFRIGRATGSDLVLGEPGVWDAHVALEFVSGDGFYAVAQGEALTTLNGAPCSRSRLCNGDRLELGGAVLQFWLGETRQRGLGFRELLVWLGIGLVTALQIFLIIRLM